MLWAVSALVVPVDFVGSGDTRKRSGTHQASQRAPCSSCHIHHPLVVLFAILHQHRPVILKHVRPERGNVKYDGRLDIYEGFFVGVALTGECLEQQ